MIFVDMESVEILAGIVRQIKIIVEKHPEGYVAYPLGIQGVVVGEGDTYEEALNDVKSAIFFISKRLVNRFWS